MQENGLTIRDVQRQIRELNKKDTKDHQIVRGLQAQVSGIQRKTDRIDRSIISSKSKGTSKTISGKKGKKNSNSNKILRRIDYRSV